MKKRRAHITICVYIPSMTTTSSYTVVLFLSTGFPLKSKYWIILPNMFLNVYRKSSMVNPLINHRSIETFSMSKNDKGYMLGKDYTNVSNGSIECNYTTIQHYKLKPIWQSAFTPKHHHLLIEWKVEIIHAHWLKER